MHNRFLKESSGGDQERNTFPEQKKDGHLDIYVLKEEKKIEVNMQVVTQK